MSETLDGLSELQPDNVATTRNKTAMVARMMRIADPPPFFVGLTHGNLMHRVA
jgi:hypothetical protein